MRQYLTLRKAAFLGALIAVCMMTRYQAGAMKSGTHLDSSTLGAASCSDAKVCTSDNGSILVSQNATAAANAQPVVQAKQTAGAKPRVYATRKLVHRHAHPVHRLSAQQDFDFGYAFGGSDLD